MTNSPVKSLPVTCDRSMVIASLVWTAAMEVMLCVARFGFGLESTRDTASTIGRLSLGIRIHHGYIGIVMILFGIFIERDDGGSRREQTSDRKKIERDGRSDHQHKETTFGRTVERFRPTAIRWLFILGTALFLSDMIHHFLVLWTLTGSPHFHLVYPAQR